MLLSIRTLGAMLLLLCFASITQASKWQDYPGNIDMGGWRVVRNQANPAEVALLGPPAEHVIVGSASEPMVGFLFTPDIIFAQTRTGATDHYYVIERDWPTESHLGEQRIVKLTGPITYAQLQANPTWNDEISIGPFHQPRAPNTPIFWKHPITYTFYALVVLGPILLIVLIPLIAIILLLVWLRRRSKLAPRAEKSPAESTRHI